jgi:hypothetical protein
MRRVLSALRVLVDTLVALVELLGWALTVDTDELGRGRNW